MLAHHVEERGVIFGFMRNTHQDQSFREKKKAFYSWLKCGISKNIQTETCTKSHRVWLSQINHCCYALTGIDFCISKPFTSALQLFINCNYSLTFDSFPPLALHGRDVQHEKCPAFHTRLF